MIVQILAQQSGEETWRNLVIGLFGGGGIVGLAGIWARKGNNKADEVATIVTASGEVVKLSSGLLASYVLEVQKLGDRVARLEGLLDQRDRQNRWLRARVAQLEDYIHQVCNFTVPHPVTQEEEP